MIPFGKIPENVNLSGVITKNKTDQRLPGIGTEGRIDTKRPRNLLGVMGMFFIVMRFQK